MNPPAYRLPTTIAALLGAALLTASASAQSYTSTVLADEPLAYYPLGDAAPVTDVAYNAGSAGAILNGTHRNVRHQAPGVLIASTNTASSFDGTPASAADRSRTLVPFNGALNPVNGSQPFTIEAWVRPTIEENTVAGQAPLFNRHSAGNRQGWVFFQRASSAVPGRTQGWNFRMYNQNGSSQSIDLTGGSYVVGDWCHLVVVWSGSSATMYVNGVQVATQAGSYAPNTDVPFGIGSYSADSAGDNPFTGDIDEVAYYPAALSATQVSEHYDNAFDGLPVESYADMVKGDGASLHFRMDEPSGDRVIAVNQGTLGAAGNGLHFPGAVHEVDGALAGENDTAIHFDAIDKASDDGGYPTILPERSEFNSASFSWEGWVRPTAAGRQNAQCVIKNHNPGNTRTGWVLWQRAAIGGTNFEGFGWNLRMYNGNGNNRTIDIVTGNGAGGYTVGQWQHLAITYNANTQTAIFYVNGNPVSTQTTTNGPYVPNPAGSGLVPSIGGFGNGTENPFEGDMDEVAFYDKVLSPTLITQHYTTGKSASPVTPYADLIAADAPVGYYRMNEAARTAILNQGTAGADADGTLVNLPLPVALPQVSPGTPVYKGFPTGTSGNQFRGSKTYAELKNPAALNFAGPITLEAWVKPDATQANFSNGIICHGLNDDGSPQEIFLRIENGNYEVGGATGKASAAVPAGDQGGTAWVHLAGTWSAGTWTLYRNGSSIATGADATGPTTVANANWAIGARGRWKRGTGFPDATVPVEHRNFSGGILGAAIYNKALSAGQVRDHFFSGVGSSLVLTQPGGVITLEWSSGILQHSDDLGNWLDVPGATSPYLPSDGWREFYRLRY